MDAKSLKKILDNLRALPKETEWVEFKEARSNFDFNKLGKYFSALSNEANLKNKECAWLVFGVRDKGRKIVGSAYRRDHAQLDALKSGIANKTTNRITFVEIHELDLSEGRVIMFQIPPAPKGIPTEWQGHFYGREGGSLNALSLQEIEQIRSQAIHYDWSAQICKNAAVDDLDPEAVSKARKEYKQKYPQQAEEVDEWNDLTFLNKAKVQSKVR